MNCQDNIILPIYRFVQIGVDGYPQLAEVPNIVDRGDHVFVHETKLGIALETIAKPAIELANLRNKPVHFEFNGKYLIANPQSRVEEIVHQKGVTQKKWTGE